MRKEGRPFWNNEEEKEENGRKREGGDRCCRNGLLWVYFIRLIPFWTENECLTIGLRGNFAHICCGFGRSSHQAKGQGQIAGHKSITDEYPSKIVFPMEKEMCGQNEDNGFNPMNDFFCLDWPAATAQHAELGEEPIKYKGKGKKAIYPSYFENARHSILDHFFPLPSSPPSSSEAVCSQFQRRRPQSTSFSHSLSSIHAVEPHKKPI